MYVSTSSNTLTVRIRSLQILKKIIFHVKKINIGEYIYMAKKKKNRLQE